MLGYVQQAWPRIAEMKVETQPEPELCRNEYEVLLCGVARGVPYFQTDSWSQSP